MLRALLVLLVLPAAAWAEVAWTLAKSEHFELYTQAGPEAVRPALLWFESLRAFFKLEGRSPIRVIAFRSRSDYREYRLRQNADAYYVGFDDRDYIVLPSLHPSAFPLAAHEFAHLAAYVSGVQLPLWLSEGLAEVYATLQITQAHSEFGGERQGHLQLLKRQSWMPLSQLLNLKTGNQTTLFYAQSWALTEMLALSPGYSSRFEQLRTALVAGSSSAQALNEVYSKPLSTIEADLQTWVRTARPALVKLPGVSFGKIEVQIYSVTGAESQAMIAELLVASGELDRAETLYRELPQTAASYGALGAISLRRGDRNNARTMWKKAVDLGLADPAICYRYAVLADEAGLSSDELRLALKRVIALKPDHEDARLRLASLESNGGNYEAALEQWNALSSVKPARAFAYWSAVANAYNELDRREEAQAAAQQALTYARTPTETAHARQLTHIAQTDLAVQFASDANGRTHMVTTRAPHGVEDWNPFIEAGDTVQRVEGKLAAIDCKGPSLQITVVTAKGRLKLTIRDTSRVQMRDAPAEFICGPQPVSPVIVDYNSDGVVRGMSFTARGSSK